jgi:hypothetical protein
LRLETMTESTKRAGLSVIIIWGKALAAALVVIGLVHFLEFGLAVAATLSMGP